MLTPTAISLFGFLSHNPQQTKEKKRVHIFGRLLEAEKSTFHVWTSLLELAFWLAWIVLQLAYKQSSTVQN